MNGHSDLRAEAEIAAKRAVQLGLTQEVIAEAVGASQSQVSRVLSGKGARRSRLFNEICKYVFSTASQQTAPEESDELKAALAEVWDGTPQHAKALALVIRSLGALGSKEASVIPRRPAGGGGDA